MGGRDVHAPHDVDLTIDQEKIFDIINRSGTGKSTLIRVIDLLNRLASDTVTVAGQGFIALNTDGLRQARRKIGMTFQRFNLLSSCTMHDNVTLPLELTDTPCRRVREIVLPLLELVGLSIRKDHYPAQTSDGQKRCVDVARVLASQPDVLFPDEAISALGPETMCSTLGLLRKINDELGLTTMLVVHQMEVIKQICDRIAVLDTGRVMGLGHVISVFPKPEYDVTHTLIGEVIS